MKKRSIAASALVVLLGCILALAACRPDTPGSTPGNTLPSGSSAASVSRPVQGMSSTGQTMPGPTQTTAPYGTEHPHIFGAWTIVQGAGCGTPEVSRRQCACGFSEEQISAQPTGIHSYGDDGQCAGCPRKVSVGLFYKLAADRQSYIVIGIGSCEDSCVVIPEVHNGKPVTVIREYAFASMGTEPSGITSVTIPGSVTHIGKGAFAGCQLLTQLHAEPDSQAFSCLDGILYSGDGKTLLVYPGGRPEAHFTVPEQVTHIGDFAFAACDRLQELDLYDGVCSIGEGAFSGSGLIRVRLGRGVEQLHPKAFSMCTTLVEIAMDEENPVFRSLDGVLMHRDGTMLYVYPAGRPETDYRVPEGVTTIAPEAFYGCRNLERLMLPDSVTEIGAGAFGECAVLREVHLGGAVRLGQDAFAWCTNLTELTMGRKLAQIGAGAFTGCISLERLTLPESLQKIGTGAFGECAALQELGYAGTVRQWLQIQRETDWDAPDTDYILRCRDMQEFSTGLAYSLLPDGGYAITGMGGCTDTAVVIPALYRGEPVTRVESEAFRGIGIESILLPDTVQAMGTGSFAGCGSLQTIRLGRDLEAIGENAFQGCTALMQVLMSEENLAYRSRDGVLYSYDGSLLVLYPAARQAAAYSLPDGVLAICDQAFAGCAAVRTLTLPATLRVIGREAFYDCGNLNTITFGGSMAQWNDLEKGSLWCDDGSRLTVTCSDGVLAWETWTLLWTAVDSTQTVQLPMVQQIDGSWFTAEPLTVQAGDRLQCIDGHGNVLPQTELVMDTAGTYILRLEPETGSITWIPAG